jgi:hypothetical protein
MSKTKIFYWYTIALSRYDDSFDIMINHYYPCTLEVISEMKYGGFDTPAEAKEYLKYHIKNKYCPNGKVCF